MIQLHAAHYPVFCDVDDTLVVWNPSQDDLLNKGVNFYWTDVNGHSVHDLIVPNTKMIQQLRLHRMRGHTIFVWSAGGEQWAFNACMALGLNNIVDHVIPKPTWIYDDKQPAEFMPKAYLLKDE